MAKELKLWNGRMVTPYRHGYVAAYSRADAIRVMAEALGYRGRAMNSEIRDYWHEGSWGNNMIGITPERGLWVQKQDNGEVFRLIAGKAKRVTHRGPEWDEFQSKEQAKYEARRRQEEQERHAVSGLLPCPFCGAQFDSDTLNAQGATIVHEVECFFTYCDSPVRRVATANFHLWNARHG